MSETTNVQKGTDYEKFVLAVYQAIIEADGITNVSVKHNIRIRGKSGCSHQIDVYWEYIMAGQTYRTAIECKAYDKEVKIGVIRDFYGVLLDIPNLNGICATFRGFQSGAKQYATHYGITLKELRVPNNEDWTNRIKDINIEFTILLPKIVKVDFHFKDNQMFTNKFEQVGLKIRTDSTIIFDKQRRPVASYNDLQKTLPTAGAPFEGHAHTFSFPDHILMAGELELEIEGVTVTYNVNTDSSSVKILGQQLALAIVKDVKSGQYTFVAKDGSARSVS